MIKSVLAAIFLSCVAAATPAHAKVDPNAGYNRTGDPGVPDDCCYTIPDGGCVFSGGKVLCSSGFMRDRLSLRKGNRIFEGKYPPVPHIIDISNLLDKTRWRVDDVYFMPRDIKKEEVTVLKTLVVYGVPAALAFGTILIVFAAFNDWGPKVEGDKDKPI